MMAKVTHALILLPFLSSVLSEETSAAACDTSIGFLTLEAYHSTKAIAIVMRISQHIVLYSIPEKRGSSDISCAIPIVNGFSIAPANPTCAATYTMHTPVKSS